MDLFLLSVSVGFLVLLLCRELCCWYFKINERNLLLIDILLELRKLNTSSRPENPIE